MSLWHEIGVRAYPHFSQGTGMVDLTDLPNACPLELDLQRQLVDCSECKGHCLPSDAQQDTITLGVCFTRLCAHGSLSH